MVEHYQACSPMGRRVLRFFDFPPNYYELECVDALRRMGWQRDAYLFNTGKYLWRLGQKDGASVLSDLQKAYEYLEWWIQENRNALQTFRGIPVTTALMATQEIERLLSEIEGGNDAGK